MAPDGGVGDVAAEQAVDGWGGEELHALAAVVAACEARLAFVADEARFNGDAVADFEVGDRWVSSEDYAGRFVAEDVGFLNDHGADAASVPEVDIGSVDKTRLVSRSLTKSVEDEKQMGRERT